MITDLNLLREQTQAKLPAVTIHDHPYDIGYWAREAGLPKPEGLAAAIEGWLDRDTECFDGRAPTKGRPSLPAEDLDQTPPEEDLNRMVRDQQRARQEEYITRHRLFELGKHIRDMVLDEDEQARIGAKIVDLSGVCENCNGTGEDGDPPDAAGVGGGRFRCDKCAGTGFISPLSRLCHAKRPDFALLSLDAQTAVRDEVIADLFREAKASPVIVHQTRSRLP